MEPNAHNEAHNPARDPQDLSPAMVASVLLVDELILGGVREAVVCPGSRSAPLALALAEADRAGRLRLHVRTDERAGAFLALGLAKAAGRAVPIVMTSGTAVANCLPAMVEASLSHVPLIVVSANRPLSMVGTGANQTIEQAKIFGSHAVKTLNLQELAMTGPVDQQEVRAIAREGVTAATDPIAGGGVHIDVPLVEPLVPQNLDSLSLYAQTVAEAETEAASHSGHTPHPRTGPRPLPHGAVTIDLALRTLVIAGAVTDEAWARSVMDELADVPTLAEPIAPAPDFPVHSAGAAMFTAGAVSQGEYSAATRPEQIVVIGRPTLHRAVSRLLADTDIRVVVLTETTTVMNVTGNVAEVGSSVKLTGEHPVGWTKVCEAISDMGAQAVRDALSASAEEHFTGLHAVAVVADSLRDGDALVLGASSAIRDASRAGLPFDGVRTIASRGAAGIDGTVSTAVGVAMAHAAQDPTALRAPRTIAVMGDLTFLHDLTGLNIGPMERRPDNLLIVVVNDAGGAIFESLEPGAEHLRTFGDGTAAYERVFGTPLDVQIESLCEGFGVDYRVATSVTELAELLADHAEEPAAGITVLEARVERAWRRELDSTIAQAVTPS